MKFRSSKARVRLALRAVLEFFMPGHLDGFEFAFVRGGWIPLEVGQFGHVAVKVGEADGKRIEFGMSFREKNADIFGVVPSERFRHRVPCSSDALPKCNCRS